MFLSLRLISSYEGSLWISAEHLHLTDLWKHLQWQCTQSVTDFNHVLSPFSGCHNDLWLCGCKWLYVILKFYVIENGEWLTASLILTVSIISQCRQSKLCKAVWSHRILMLLVQGFFLREATSLGLISVQIREVLNCCPNAFRQFNQWRLSQTKALVIQSCSCLRAAAVKRCNFRAIGDISPHSCDTVTETSTVANNDNPVDITNLWK